MSAKRIQRSKLEAILAAYNGTGIFARCLQGLTNDRELLRILSQYVYFNSVFGSGVANLAGEIAARQDLFRDTNEAIDCIADRSMEVANGIFFAAIDEFGSPFAAGRNTHRALAQALLKATGLFFGYRTKAINALTHLHDSTLALTNQVREGYGVNQHMSDHCLFRAIGFHLGSEILADQEFRVLEEALQVSYPDLVKHLKQTKTHIDKVPRPAYHWIRLHTHVEAEHFEAGVTAANRALQFYAGSHSLRVVQSWMITGFSTFSALQATFMTSLKAEAF